MTLEQLDALRKLIQMTTPGPWVWRGPSSDDPADLWTADGKDAIVCVQTTNDDVRFIQAMREYAEPLVEAAWQLAAELPAAWREDLESLQGIVERLGKERDAALATVEQMRKERDEALDTVGAARDIVCLTTIGCGECQLCVALLAEQQLTRELEAIKADRDDARSDLAFIEAEYAKANNSDLTRDALALKIAALELDENRRWAIEFAEVSKLLDAQGIDHSLQGGPLSPAERVQILVSQRDEARRWLKGSREEVQRLTQERWETASKQAEVIQKATKERDEARQELADTKAALKLLSEMFRDISMGSAR